MTTTGVWLVGARGNVATTAIAGAKALARGETDTTGLVTAREPAERLELPDVGEFVFGGHDIGGPGLLAQARALSERGVPSPRTVEAVAEDLRAVEDRIRPGTAVNCGPAVEELGDGETVDDRLTVAETVARIRDDYASFRAAHDLDRVVVINVASTEPPLDSPERYDTRDAFRRAVDRDDRDIPASALYAYAALLEGHPYANFTPSTGSALGGLRELAIQQEVPHVGRDAKTGETLLKSALGPMFAGRNLRVRSWEGHNLLGNGDGLVLEDDRNAAGKLRSKGDVLSSLLPDIDHSAVRIDYAPSLGDWKTAWDYVHFEGFLDTEMTMQFTWEGSDSALAAPLVLDLARLLAHADSHGAYGLQTQLASFFKDPLGVDEHDLSRQFDLLADYVDRHAGGGGD